VPPSSMTTHAHDLYNKLTDAYSDANLNRITARLLDLYRSKQHSQLRELARRISDVVPVDGSNISKCFSQLVMLYHPDRGEATRREIERLSSAGREGELQRFSHILLVGDFGHLPPAVEAPAATDFVSEYEWDAAEVDSYNGREWDEQTLEDEQFAVTGEVYEHTFFQAVKMKFYGTLQVELPYYYLEDLEEIEMAECGIVSLDGVEHCRHARVIDISGNAIEDLSELRSLNHVSELYASGNAIGYVDALSSLVNLRIVDLSLNDIDDLSPLFGLERLEFVNVMGNPLPAKQIDRLRTLGCTVLC
jgi:Leucine-rich repeat (LRR) protein